MINARAIKKPEFREILAVDPVTALGAEFGVEIPDDVIVEVFPEEQRQWNIVLRQPPVNASSMSEQEIATALIRSDFLGGCF